MLLAISRSGKVPVDLRFEFELVGLALSQYYHCYYYPCGDRGGALYTLRATPAEISSWLAQCVVRLPPICEKNLDELPLRLRTQVFCNVIFLYLLDGWIGPQVRFPVDDPALDFAAARAGLQDVVRRRGGEAQVSYLVLFLLCASGILEKQMKGALSRDDIIEAIARINSLLEEKEGRRRVIPYDREKMDRFKQRLEVELQTAF